MIVNKSLKVPDIDEKVLRITPAYLQKSERVFRHAPVGLCEEAGKFVVAEGSKDIMGMPQAVQELLADPGDVFWRTINNLYYRLSDSMNIGFGYYMKQLLTYADEEGNPTTIFVGERVFRAGGSGFNEVTQMREGGTCVALHHERLFIGKGNTLSYSAPYQIEEWGTENEGAGKLKLSAIGGDIFALLSFQERLYVFRKHEILRIRADARDINFRIERVHLDYGAVIEDSVQPCGEKFVFFTDRGIVAGDGSAFKYIPMERLGASPASPMHSGYSDGKYYALVRRTTGENCILVYDPETDKYHFLEENTTMLAGAGNGVYYGHGIRLCRLQGRGFLEYGTKEGKLEAELEISKSDGSLRCIDAVSVTGKGTYTLTLETEEGERILSLKADKRERLSKVLRGAFLNFRLATKDAACELCSLNLHFREETP